MKSSDLKKRHDAVEWLLRLDSFSNNIGTLSEI
jgi:hypothetical protein